MRAMRFEFEFEYKILFVVLISKNYCHFLFLNDV